MTFRTLIVGLGRSGAGLHLPALTLARASRTAERLFDPGPVLAFDPDPSVPNPCAPNPGVPDPLPETVRVDSLAAAADRADPGATVVHLCTPPTARVEVIARLAELGFRRILVEKPLTADEASLAEIELLRDRWDLNLIVVAQWLASPLTARIERILAEGRYGSLRSIGVIQHKPRFTRSQCSGGHPTAFDVEVPHSVGLALEIAGTARVLSARWADMTFEDVTIPRLGAAWLELGHATGVRTRIHSDLTAPDRERRITLELDGATLTGHYPSSGADDYAQLRIAAGGRTHREIFPDNALTAFMTAAYERFARGWDAEDDSRFTRGVEVVRLIGTAKRICAGEPACQPLAG
jgi:predicted dehydrogenase